MEPDGSNMVQITFGSYHDIEPNTTDDGQIVFIRWGREYETLYDCTQDNIDDPISAPNRMAAVTGTVTVTVSPGLEEPKDWTTDDKCGASVPGIRRHNADPGFHSGHTEPLPHRAQRR